MYLCTYIFLGISVLKGRKWLMFSSHCKLSLPPCEILAIGLKGNYVRGTWAGFCFLNKINGFSLHVSLLYRRLFTCRYRRHRMNMQKEHEKQKPIYWRCKMFRIGQDLSCFIEILIKKNRRTNLIMLAMQLGGNYNETSRKQQQYLFELHCVPPE